MELHVAQADVTTLTVDALVLPCTSMGTVAQPIRTELPESVSLAIEAELKAKTPLAVGAALLVDPSAFAASNLILVPVVKQADDPIQVQHLRRAVKAALIAAKVKRYQTLALPCMIPMSGDTTRSEGARAVVQEINAHTDPFPEKIYLVDQKEDMVRIFDHAIHSAQYAL